MPESQPSDKAPVDEIANQLQAGAAATADAAQAVDKAVQTAAEISDDIRSAVPIPPRSDPANASAGLQPAPVPAPASPASARPAPASPELQRLLSIEVPIIVQLGVRRMSVGEVMRLAVGAIIEFQKAADDELELLANNKTVGTGHAVKVGENFGIKLASIGSVREVIQKLGGGSTLSP